MFDEAGLTPQEILEIEEAFVRQSLVRRGDEEFQALLSEHLMQGELLPVPQTLLDISGRVLTNSAPEFQIRLHPENVITSVVSAVRGFFSEPLALDPVRSVGLERRPALDIGKAGSVIRYRIIRESEAEVLLAVRVDAPGALRASLRRDGRIVASQTMAIGESSLAFEHLGAGNYTLEITGSRAESVSFHINSEV